MVLFFLKNTSFVRIDFHILDKLYQYQQDAPCTYC